MVQVNWKTSAKKGSLIQELSSKLLERKQTYTVQAGDTLSAIAKKQGVKVADISGYRSGNPDLIYPGETLTFGTTTPPANIVTVGAVPKITKPPSIPSLNIQPSPTTTAASTTAVVPQITSQVITQPPIITTSATPKVGTSQIDAGKQAIKDLTALGVSTDINTIKSNYIKFGLNTKLGNWIGSTTQWNAYAKYAQDELDRIGKEAEGIQAEITATQERIATEGITPTPETPTPEVRAGDTGGVGDISGGGTTLDPTTLSSVQLSNLDIGDIITEMEEGTAATPESIIAGEVAQLLTDEEKAKAGQALAQFQQQMATAGQAFSSIRSSGEERLAAESLARISGIKLDLADKIIKAARQEQTRRINAVQLQQNAQTAALKSMGYVMNPVTGKLSKTLERQRFEEPAQPQRFTSGGNIYEYDPSTGAINTLIEGVGSQPNSFQEWTLAGEEAGTGMSYAQFLADRGESQSERDRALRIAALSLARTELEKSKGTDGYFNSALYVKLRSNYAQAVGDVSDFDDAFFTNLNPADPSISFLKAQIIGI